MCHFLCGKIIREWNTENTHKLTGLLGYNEKRRMEKEEREENQKRELFWKRTKIMKRVLKKEKKIQKVKKRKISSHKKR